MATKLLNIQHTCQRSRITAVGRWHRQHMTDFLDSWHVQISVGRLGIITAVTFRIRKNQPIVRDILKTDFAGMATKLLNIQHAYNAANTPADKAAAIAPLNLLQTTW